MTFLAATAVTQDEFTRLGSVLNEIEREGSETRSGAAAIRLLMLTGCSRSEIQPLRWEHVDLDASELQLRDAKTTLVSSPSAINVLAPRSRESVGHRRKEARVAPNRSQSPVEAHSETC